MSIFKKTLSCAVLAALGTCALAGYVPVNGKGAGRIRKRKPQHLLPPKRLLPSRKPSPKVPLPLNKHRPPKHPGHSPLKPNQQFPRRPLSMTPPPSDSTALSMWRTGS